MNMPVSKLSDEYYERKNYLKTNTVPTQSVMRKRMTPALSNVYFKSMRPKVKVFAGLAPPLKGGGSDWYVPPEELFRGRLVLKPIKKEQLLEMGFDGLTHVGEKFFKGREKKQERFRAKKLEELDNYWKFITKVKSQEHELECKQKIILKNKHKIERAFHQFCFMYSTSLNNLEELLLTAAIKDVQRYKSETYQYMQTRYEMLVNKQAKRLYDHYAEGLLQEKQHIKSEFIKKLHTIQKCFTNQMHDINVEKHTVIEKLRNFLECQNLACQVYVALKEKEACAKQIEEIKRKHKKQVKLLTEQIALKEFEIKLAKEKERKRHVYQNVWRKKICEVVKKFQLFVTYCLNELPECAEFFVNTEKLLLLQLNEVLENPDEKSLFESDKTDSIHTPIPRPHPYFLFWDNTSRPDVDQELCPKHCTSSASQFPVIVVNKRCIYAACDNFKTFTEKVTEYINGKRGDDKDFVDHHDYTNSVPIQCTSSDQIQHLKLESSLQQLLQNEWANIRNLPLECCSCRIPHCFCSNLRARMSTVSTAVSSQTLTSIDSGNKINTREVELEHEREPKWESYLEYVKSKKCNCSKMAKNHLEEHLPPYMRQMSAYETPDLPHYEMCDLETLKKMVRESQGKRTPTPAPASPVQNSKDIGTQYSDLNFEYLCTCFSEEKDFTSTIDSNCETEAQCKLVTGSITATYLDHSTQSFVTGRTQSLKNLLNVAPELEEIFRRNDCKFH